MKKPLIIGNWKANPSTFKEARLLLRATEKAITKVKGTYGYAVPDVYLSGLLEEKTKGILGVENLGHPEGGAHTGKSTVTMVKSVGGKFVILGHSEVRASGETDETINEKLKAALTEKLYCIVCVGEATRDPHGKYLQFIEGQLKTALHGIRPELCEYLAIAYEPIWAVGAKVSATTEECFEAVIAVRRTVATLFGIAHAKKVHVLYGGTVTKENAQSFLIEGGADGLLIGRTSLDAKAFAAIISE